jgi:hypothetical protein
MPWIAKHEPASNDRMIRGILRRPAFWMIFVLVLHVLILVNAAQLFLYAVFAGKPPQTLHYLGWSMSLWYTRAALVPPTVWIAARNRFEPGRWFRHLAVYTLSSTGLALLMAGIQGRVVTRIDTARMYYPTVAPESVHLTKFQTVVVRGWPKITYNMLTCWMVIALVQGVYYHEDANRRRLEALRLQTQLATARLDALRMQLNPHFLFNTLHAISTLIEDEPRVAEEMILRLSHLLRSILDEKEPEISLRRELRFLDDHLAIEKVRFGDRLDTSLAIDDSLLDCFVPQLILQPLVENVIQHGIGKNSGHDMIEIKASHESGQLRIELRNSNSRLKEPTDTFSRVGIGLSNTKMRLQALYQDQCSLLVKEGSPAGVTVSISLPFRKLSALECQREREIQA